MNIVTRFAPSPTGTLHIGGARTALFNWLYARHCHGTFRLRIEDTDRKRSTQESVQAIFDALDWLGIDWDGEPVFQFARSARHREIVRTLLDSGHAYRCYMSSDDLQRSRTRAKDEGRIWRYDGTWRDRDPGDAPPGVTPAIRLKAPREGHTIINDHVQGEVAIANAELDDMVLLRADGTPTYMLSVVVDDHEMGVTHVIRGDEHLVNAARQSQIYQALAWTPPEFAHIPLIHGADGTRLSKRHGATGIEHYREEGFLADALVNHLLRLGWSHGDEEVISRENAVHWFDFPAIGKSPARFDPDRLSTLNRHYIRNTDDTALARLATPHVAGKLARNIDDGETALLLRAMPVLKERSRTLVELAKHACFLFHVRPLLIEPKAAKLLGDDAVTCLAELLPRFDRLESWDVTSLEACVREFSEERSISLGMVAQPLRAALTGSTVSPPIFDVLALLGRDECLARIKDVTQIASP
ncbi:MAG: glutamate--tRNA ligase [Alphaproteobacteria bacterium]|nr:glutamate--tRNA ligase [Alphaproteobacteria bacterium]